ncbi:MAG: DoxX family membrane protein [bacterium]|nr:DoxX family membrane protein [bacterium]
MRNRNLAITIIIGIIFLLQFIFPEFFASLPTHRLFTNPDSNIGLLITHWSLLPLKISLAFVFMWFGIDNLAHPEGFDNIGDVFLEKLGIKHDFNLQTFGRLQGIVEILLSIALLTGFYLDLASLIATALLALILIVFWKASSMFVRDLGLLGSALTLLLITTGGK